MVNFILVVADDLGWGDVGYHGSRIETPVIDALASAGTRFSQFYTAPICTPTRVALQTGCYPHRFGLQQIVWPWNADGLPLEVPTIAETLRGGGYQTALIGKWNLGHASPAMTPLRRGYDFHLGCYTGCIDHWAHTFFDIHDFHREGAPAYPPGHTTDIYTNTAIQWISNRDRARPFLLVLTYNAPHVPLQSYPYFANLYHDLPEDQGQFAGMVTHLDFSIGRIVAALRRFGCYEDTLLWFTSDNGGWVGFGGNNGDLRGGKIGAYEGGVRVCNFLNYPPRNGGLEVNVPMHAADVYPTLAALAGIPLPTDHPIDGLDAFAPPDPDRAIPIVMFSGGRGVIRRGRWKLHCRGESAPDELYDLEADPGERVNLAESSPEVVRTLVIALVRYGAEFVLDPQDRWSPPNGPPAGFAFPKVWGPIDPTPTPVELPPDREEDLARRLMGYPITFPRTYRPTDFS